MGFTKLDSGIVNSSVWAESLATRVLWITMLAMSDENGFVSSSKSGLLRAANVPVDDFDVAIKTLESPDVESRTPDNNGRRVEKIDGGWVILNFMKYRARSEVIKEQTKERVKRFRDKKNKSVTLHSLHETLPSASASASASASGELSCDIVLSDEEMIFKHWNLKSPKTHKSLSEAAAANIKKLLLTHSVEDLKACIDNYSSVVTSKTSWYTYKSILEEFFRPGKLKPAPHIRFLPDNFIPDNYKAKDAPLAANQSQSYTEAPQSTMVPVTVIISRIAKYFPDGIDYPFFPPQSDEKKWNHIYNRVTEMVTVREREESIVLICKELEKV
jgi:hypothetical protein